MPDEASSRVVIDKLGHWVEEGRRLRDALIAERKALLQRLTELDHAMAMLPKPVRGEEVQVPMDQGIFQGVPEMVRNQLRASGPRGMTAEEIIAALEQVAPGLDTRNIHSALYRGVKRGEFIKTGRRGTSRYKPTAQGGNG